MVNSPSSTGKGRDRPRRFRRERFANLHSHSRAREEGGFIVRVPALPEIVTEGDTEEEALAMAQDAIELVLLSRRELGGRVPD
jgi:antitoxin HicB